MLKEYKTFVYECDRCGANSDNQNGFDAVLPSGWTQGGSMVCCPVCPPAQAPGDPRQMQNHQNWPNGSATPPQVIPPA